MRQGKWISIKNSKSELNHTASICQKLEHACSLWSLGAWYLTTVSSLYYNNILIFL